MFVNNFTNQLIRKKILCVCMHHKIFHLTCNMLLRYLVKFENQKRNFQVERDN